MTSLPLKNQQLLDLAFTHRSFLNEHPAIKEHNERLEFLGDAVLELATSEFLYRKYPLIPEGDLTAYRAALVKTTSLAKIAAELGFGEQLKLSKGEELSGGRHNPSLLADTFESVIGAIYLDQGYQAVMDFLTLHLFPKIDYIVEHKLFKDFKSSLQEKVQSRGHASPDYVVVEETGPDHDKIFVIAVKIAGDTIATGQGKSKQEAQQQAAKSALEKLAKT
jgi:ribonuclease III